MEENFSYALILTLLAGLSTGIGSLIGLYARQTSRRFFAFVMGFAAGVMIYLAFTDMYALGNEHMSKAYGESLGMAYSALAFFLGIGMVYLIDKTIPSYEDPHELKYLKVDEKDNVTRTNGRKIRFFRMGILVAVSLALHNFPEGVATFSSAIVDPQLGLIIAVAIALHNIPEGIAVSAPVYLATGSKKKAFAYSFISGLAEPVGGILGFYLMRSFFSDALFGVMFSFVAGIMAFIALDQLLPAAEKFDAHSSSLAGLVAGMIVMAASILLLQ